MVGAWEVVIIGDIGDRGSGMPDFRALADRPMHPTIS